MLTDTTGRPYAPDAIRRSLKAIDPRLDLLHFKPPLGSGGARQEHGTWAFILRWPENDKRRVMIRRGEMAEDADFDYLGEIPFDCSLEQARGYFERCIGRFPADTANGVAQLRERIAQWNAAQAASNTEGARELGLELLDANKSNPEFAASLGVGTVVTKAQGAGVGGSDVARRTGRSASELAAAFMAAGLCRPLSVESRTAIDTRITEFVTAVEGAAGTTPEVVEAVVGLLVLRGDVVIQPTPSQAASEQSARDRDFETALAEQRAKKAAEDAAAAAKKDAKDVKPVKPPVTPAKK